jgi:Fe-S-cluster-containing hydrogenase component 2
MSYIPLVSREDDEGLFSRVDGQLVRLDKPTKGDYDKEVTLQVDGRSVTLPIAEPSRDAQGHIVLDIQGRTTPRYTTILDAVVKINAELNDELNPGLNPQRREGEKEVFIPTLCHQPHMTPVAVCRLCVVQVYGMRDGKRSPERKLLPACQHQVKEGMEVFTMYVPGGDGDRVRRAVGIVTELLMADHLKPAPAPAPAEELAPFNELQQMVDLCDLESSRFGQDAWAKGVRPLPVVEPPVASRALDSSSPVFVVDHTACILCDRCSRACSEVKNNNVIGRTGKGRTAGIGFDLNDKMFESSCVQCGECMVSCPTSAITFKPAGEVRNKTGPASELVPLAEMRQHKLFTGVPAKFLLWQKGLVVRRRLKANDYLCRHGEPGHSAFIIREGELQVKLPGLAPIRNTVKDVIVGEMACLSGSPRTGDIYASADSEVWEVRRNVLDRMMRSPSQHGVFEELYRKRSLAAALRNSELFHDLPPEERDGSIEFLGPRLDFVRINPGQTIFRQGDLADNMYLIRLGHVRVGISRHGQPETVLYKGPGTVVGEMGLLASSGRDARRSDEEVYRSLCARVAHADATGLAPGERTATCSALDHVELARVSREVFLELVLEFPTLLFNVVRMALNRLRTPDTPLTRQFVEQGLYQGRSLLTLDLTRCTGCDECTKACVRQHGTASHGQPITRLVREGLRFGDFLVATSCRSCRDAYCMIGCPVDAIHRGKHHQIVIEDHCIGCGLCARNCPYDNISMDVDTRVQMEADDPDRPGHTRQVARAKAATCDLCDSEGREEHPVPQCVYSCPHDAAHRMTGEELLERVLGSRRL